MNSKISETFSDGEDIIISDKLDESEVSEINDDEPPPLEPDYKDEYYNMKLIIR